VYLFSNGKVEIEGLFAPSWPFLPKQGLRYAIALGDEKPQVVELTKDMSAPTWEETARSDVRRSVTEHQVTRVGKHKLRIYSLDSGVSLQKILINTGGLQPSYLGPEESKRY
jgi:Gylcosyl hydrolase family 115 C-terminal domain